MTGLAPFSRAARQMAAALAYDLARAAVQQQHGSLAPATAVPAAGRRRGATGRFEPQADAQMRREVAYAAAVILSAPKKRLAPILGITPAAMRQACAQVEDARATSADVDRRLDELELALMSPAGASHP